ncbi:membrane protein [sediment metagenome]|uniref:Membrane protein n=1 Tax=sediment metagenome TaxID=749907 RepID=D9PJS6_9ZZZZ
MVLIRLIGYSLIIGVILIIGILLPDQYRGIRGTITGSMLLAGIWVLTGEFKIFNSLIRYLLSNIVKITGARVSFGLLMIGITLTGWGIFNSSYRSGVIGTVLAGLSFAIGLNSPEDDDAPIHNDQ